MAIMWCLLTKLATFTVFFAFLLPLIIKYHLPTTTSPPPPPPKPLRRSVLASQSTDPSTPTPPSLSSSSSSLSYDFYYTLCPNAEYIVRSTTADLFSSNPAIAPALLRLFFHDCFIQGCDGSVLLGRVNGSESERDAVPNQTLKGFNEVEAIKAKLEEVCPGTVSCADVLVLAARDGVVLSGGPFYPVLTGRRDSMESYFSEATRGIPAPNDTYEQTIANFGSRGFTEMETVALLGAHSVGKVHCRFFEDRLSNYADTRSPDSSIDPEFLPVMQAACNHRSSNEESGLDMGFSPEEQEKLKRTGRFDSYYYNKLLEGRGILRADQQLTAGRTVRWVHAYATGERGFRGDFARAMTKMSMLKPLVGSLGQIRTHCSQVA